MSTLPQYGGNPVNHFPLPIDDPDAVSRIFTVGAGADNRLRRLSNWLAAADPAFRIPDSASGAIVTNWGPDLAGWNIDPNEGEWGADGSAFLWPVWTGMVPGGAMQTYAAPLVIASRAALLSLNLSAANFGFCTMSVVWTA